MCFFVSEIIMRPNSRDFNELRKVTITRNYTKHAEGSVLISFGDTKVLCNASVQLNFVPKFRKGTGAGWVTAEYGMLPRATHDRTEREAKRGQQTGRTQEIQRVIARSLRSCLDLVKLGEHSITIDCDVIQADGGTRTAAITGSYVALHDAITSMLKKRQIGENPIVNQVAAVSAGIFQNTPILDLEYLEDSQAETDMNVIMNDKGEFIEVQGTAEGKPMSQNDLFKMISLAEDGIKQLIELQKQALNIK